MLMCVRFPKIFITLLSFLVKTKAVSPEIEHPTKNCCNTGKLGFESIIKALTID